VPLTFVDLAGLTRDGSASAEYIDALDLGEYTPISPEHRLTMLKRLVGGAGVHIVTGPEGAPFWLPASVEVHVDIRPDGYELKERCEPDLAWALQAVGVAPLPAAALAVRYAEGKAPTPKAKVYTQFQQALLLLDKFLEHTDAVGSIIVEASDIAAVTDTAEQLRLLDRVENVALDWEWNIDEARGEMFAPEGLSIATADRTWYLPVIAADYASPFGHEADLRAAVQRAIMRTPTVWHNAKADLGTQWQGAPLDAFGSPLHDTLVMAFVAGESDLALKPLTRKRLGRDPLDFPGTMRDLPLEVCRRYGGADARNTYDLFGSLWRTLHERSQLHIYEDIERPIIPILVDMERYGHPLDPRRAIELRDVLAAQCEEIRQRFLAEDNLDIEHDKDTRELIRRRAGYDPGSLKKEAISKIQGGWMDDILHFRSWRHRKRAFLDKHIGKWELGGMPDDWNVYTSFNQAGTADAHEMRGFRHAPRSGRLSASSPDRTPPGAHGAAAGNGQNQPSDTKEIFVAPPGMVVWAKDYSQLEMRIAAARSHDAGMLAAVNGGDPHGHFQQRIFDLSGKQISRTAAKQGGFNSLYGGREDMLRTILTKQRVFLSDEDLALIVKSHEQAYPGLYSFDEQVIAWARTHGYSESEFGRRRYDPDIFSADNRTRLHAERALVNHAKGQATAADILKLAMKFIQPVLKHYGAHLALQIHDELEGFCWPETAAAFLADIDKAVAPLQLPGVTLTMSGGYGKTWAEAHG
jgi:DNA polymerase-1